MRYTSRYNLATRLKGTQYAATRYMATSRNKKFPMLCASELAKLFPILPTRETIRVILADNEAEAGTGAIPIKAVRAGGSIYVYTCYRLWFLFFKGKYICTTTSQDNFIREHFKFNKSTILWLNAHNIGSYIVD